MSCRLPGRLVLYSALLCLSVGLTQAQEARGTISGRVTDTTGAVVAGAPVTVTNTAMGTKAALTTNSQGFYSATFLIPGQYEVVVEAPGFKRALRDKVDVRVNDRLEINLTLEVGTAEQSITVSSDAPLLSTATASSGQVIDGRRAAELPVPHGNPLFLIGLAAGTVSTGNPRLDRPYEPTHIASYGVDGTRGNRSDITLDGAPATARANGGEVIATYMPPADLVAEFKVQTSAFDAAVGQTEGGVTNLSIRSGTNQLHGTLYYSNMTPGLFANDFFANATGTPRPDFSYHRWGASLGGPIVLPKLYNGRNRTFFMWGYEGIDDHRPRYDATTPQVPTEAMKNGDFSALLALGPQYQIYNPFTRRSIGNGRFQQDPFPNNIIPANLFDPVGAAILRNYYPSPLQAGNADFTGNYRRPELTENSGYWTNTVRVDHSLSDRQRFYVRASLYDRDSDYNNYFNNLATGTLFQFQSRNVVMDDVITLNATTVLDVRYGYNRFVRASQGNPEAIGFNLTSLGFPAPFNATVPDTLPRFPRIDLTGYLGTGIGGEFRPNDVHSIASSVQKIVGAHNVRTGFEFRSYRQNFYNLSNEQVGRFNFDSSWTRGPLDNSTAAPNNVGQSIAALLLGLPSASNSYIRRASDYAEQSTAWGFFVQDDWKVNPRLTLNLGLRYELETPLTERYNRSVRGLDPNFVQPFSAQAQANYAANPTATELPGSAFRATGGLLFAGVDGQPRGLYNTTKTNFMPRFGLAYQWNDRTVIRSGYGIYYGFLGQRRGDVLQNGFSLDTPFIPTTDNGLTFTNRLSNPFPTVIEPVGAALGGRTLVGQSISFFNTDPKTPYMQRWQFSVQRQLGSNLVFEAGYVGNRGTRIEIARNLNATPVPYLGTGATRDQNRINYLTQNVANPFLGLAGANQGILTSNQIARERLLRPFPQFDAVNTTTNQGYSWYHSLQLQLEKRFSRGFTLTGAYTLAKFMQATEYANAADLLPTEVISDQDAPNRFVVSGIWELPFGRGRRFVSSAGTLVSQLIGGWQINGVYQYQSGLPINWSANTVFNGNIKDIELPAGERNVNRWFNTDAGFVRNTAQLLDAGRQLRQFPLRLSSLRGDPTNNLDASLFKNTRFGERYNLQIRGELLNALNHPQFALSNLVVDPSAATFGRYVSSTQWNYSRRVQLTVKFLF